MRVLLVSTCKEKLHEKEFVGPYVNYLGDDASVVYYAKLRKADIEQADRIIICGTGLADNGYLEHLENFEWLRDVQKPVVGVCSGAQIVACVFGGKIIPDKLIGMVEVVGDFFGRQRFEAYVLHQNGFTVPRDFDVLARSRASLQAIKPQKKPN